MRRRTALPVKIPEDLESITTAPAGVVVNGGTLLVSEAIGNKVIHPFNDFLLHDIGAGDGIVQGGPQDTAAKLRTAPLWVLRMKARYMHDLASLTLERARQVEQRFRTLIASQKQQVILFLKSL